MKKGFTLIELLAVIILLAVIAIIATPIVMNVIEESKDSANKRSIEGYARAIKQAYYNEQASGEKPVIDDEFLANIDTVGGKVTCHNVIYNDEYGVVLNLCEAEEKLDKQYCYLNEKHYDCNDKEYTDKYAEFGPTYIDLSGANSPKLYDNMIPIMYDGNNWIYANHTQAWYDYDQKEWANAIVLNKGVTKNIGDVISEDEIALWYVWIPRYTYTIFNGNNGTVAKQLIDIKFESGTASNGTVTCVDNVNGNGESSEICTDETNGSIVNGTSTYTHPAFTFGNEELTGFWVGKFEISTTDTTCNSNPNDVNCNKILPLKIVPGISSFRYANISNFYNSIKNLKTEYNLNGDSHMIKNMEWGAVTYLTNSNYGLGMTEMVKNSNNNYIAGGEGVSYKTNTNQSTTGNIYGIYDISGCAWEYVMGTMVGSNGNFYSNYSGFTAVPDNKYYDKYTYNASNTNFSRGKLGDATKETLTSLELLNGSWNGDYSYSLSGVNSWTVRGGHHGDGSGEGIFSFYHGNGSPFGQHSSRAIIS